jgi:hypothetical protein
MRGEGLHHKKNTVVEYDGLEVGILQVPVVKQHAAYAALVCEEEFAALITYLAHYRLIAKLFRLSAGSPIV